MAAGDFGWRDGGRDYRLTGLFSAQEETVTRRDPSRRHSELSFTRIVAFVGFAEKKSPSNTAGATSVAAEDFLLCPEKIERRHQDKYRRRLRKEGELKNDAPGGSGCSPSSCVPLCGRRNEKVPRRERRPFVRRRKGRLESHSARFRLLAELGGGLGIRGRDKLVFGQSIN